MKHFVKSLRVTGGRVDQEEVCCLSILNEKSSTISFIFHNDSFRRFADDVLIALGNQGVSQADDARRTDLEILISSIRLHRDSLVVAVDQFELWAHPEGFVLVISGANRTFDVKFDAAAALSLRDQLEEIFQPNFVQRHLH